ncbi:MAG: hypothetical protein AB9866_18790 [Syntrophobacteraceae bacterium]
MTLDFTALLSQLPTAAVLDLIGLEPKINGNYLYVPCQTENCEGSVAFCSRGEKQNLGYCPKCKKGTNLLKYAEKRSGQPIREVAELLAKQVLKIQTTDRNKPLPLDYALEPAHYPEEYCREMELGICRKGILAGHYAYAVHNDKGVKIAYVGWNLKDKKWKLPKQLDPLAVLYNLHRIEGSTVYVTSLIEECVWLFSYGIPVVATFGNEILTGRQIELISRFKFITFISHDNELVSPLGSSQLLSLSAYWRIRPFPTKEEEIARLL